MKDNNFGIILAAGRGRRFGGLKQFALVKKKPLFLYSARAFETCSVIKGFVIVTNVSRIRQVQKLLEKFRFRKVIAVVAGGQNRMDSMEQGLFTLPREGYVAIHDGVRPMVTPAMLYQGFRACRRYPGVIFGLPVKETLKEVIGNRVVSTVDRSNIIVAQTPQFFPLELIRRACAQARNRKLIATDDSQLIELLEVHPYILPGSSLNIKVTTREDIRICKALL